MTALRQGAAGLMALALGLCLSTAPAAACTCTSLPTFQEAVDQSDAIFAGSVVAIEPAGPEHPDHVWAILHSTSWWKGPPTWAVRVLTGAHDGVCGVGFQVGHEYLVYALLAGEVLWTHSCWRTHETWAEDPDLAALGPPQVVSTHAGTWGAVRAAYR